MIVRRDGSPVESAEVAGGLAHWLYGAGRPLLPLLSSHLVARTYGRWAHSPHSARRIAGFCRTHGIGVADREWTSFADFFERDFPRPPLIEDDLVSPADAKLTVVPIGADSRLRVKGAAYTVDELLGLDRLGRRGGLDKLGRREGLGRPDFAGGHAFVLRLTIDDHHHYLYPATGRLVRDERVPGLLHTVGPASWGLEVLSENERRWQLFETNDFGPLVTCQVGAMLVGSITNHALTGDRCTKGSEQGWFALGGSTIVLLTGPAVTPEADILELNALGHEVRVRAGERIARAHDEP